MLPILVYRGLQYCYGSFIRFTISSHCRGQMAIKPGVKYFISYTPSLFHCAHFLSRVRALREVLASLWTCGIPLTEVANESASFAQSTSHISRQIDICLSRVISHKAKPGIYIPRIYISIVNKSLYFYTALFTAKGRVTRNITG